MQSVMCQLCANQIFQLNKVPNMRFPKTKGMVSDPCLLLTWDSTYAVDDGDGAAADDDNDAADADGDDNTRYSL